MTLFCSLALKILPLYLIMLLGFVADKKLSLKGEHLGSLIIYMLLPAVIFKFVANTHIDLEILALPIFLFFLASLLCFFVLFISQKIWSDSRANVQALMSGTGNMGYFGLPVALTVLDESAIGYYILGILGINIFESTVGFYVTAKSSHSKRESLLKVAKLPSLYAFFSGLFISVYDFEIPAIFENLLDNMQGAYIILGLMMTGLSLASIKRVEFDFKFLSVSLIIKFILQPAFFIGFVFLDKLYFEIFDSQIHMAIMLMSLMPIAANSVVYATILKAHPNQVATAVFVSTLIALVYVPLVVGFL